MQVQIELAFFLTMSKKKKDGIELWLKTGSEDWVE